MTTTILTAEYLAFQNTKANHVALIYAALLNIVQKVYTARHPNIHINPKSLMLEVQHDVNTVSYALVDKDGQRSRETGFEFGFNQHNGSCTVVMRQLNMHMLDEAEQESLQKELEGYSDNDIRPMSVLEAGRLKRRLENGTSKYMLSGSMSLGEDIIAEKSLQTVFMNSITPLLNDVANTYDDRSKIETVISSHLSDVIEKMYGPLNIKWPGKKCYDQAGTMFREPR